MREAKAEDIEVIYMMGYDVWGDKMSQQEYVNSCKNSSKYQKGKWYVLEDLNTKELLSSLIVYNLNPSEEITVRGIGSIATPIHLRSNGYAAALIKKVIVELEEMIHCRHFFLYSDIGVDYYKKLDFIKLPPSKQKYQDSICMYYSKEFEMDTLEFEIPAYF